MHREIKHLREFGDCQLDVEKKVLWQGGKPVALPLKAIELLCVLVERGGEVVSKEEIWREVWQDSFVEETNLTHNVYLLRKTFKNLGEANLIETVPRRGYRFAGEVREPNDSNDQMIIEQDAGLQPVEENSVSSEFSSELGRNTDQSKKNKSRQRFLAAWVLVVMLSVLFAGFIVWSFNRNSSGGSAVEIKSIAVLPMKSFDKTHDDETLGLRMTDSLITKLGNLEAISVRPTRSIQHFFKVETDALEAGRILGVDAVLDGRIQREGEKLRITLQLILVRNGEQLWSEQFDGQANQLLNLQDAISSKLLTKINLTLTPEETAAFAKRPTENTEAFENYLKGRYFWQKRNAESLQTAINFFAEAIAADPNFAEAYVGLADSYYLLVDYSYDTSAENVSLAKKNLLKAIELKPDYAEAYVTLGLIETTYEWDWQRAEKSLIKAIELSPNLPNAHHRLGMLMLKLRRFQEAEREMRRAKELDPLSLSINMNLGVTLYFSKQFDKAIDQLNKTIELDPNFVAPRWYLARCYWAKGDKNASLTEYARAIRATGDEESAAWIEQQMILLTPEKILENLAQKWSERISPTGINEHDLGVLSAQQKKSDETLRWLEKSVASRHPWATWINAEPEFDFLRDHPRFQQMLRKINLN